PRTAQEWDADVNNFEGEDLSFVVWVMCATMPSGYVVQTGAVVENPSLTQTHAVVSCPAKTVPLGGGSFSSSRTTGVALNTTEPVGRGWQVDMNNQSAFAANVSPVVICAKKPRGYRVITSDTVTNLALERTVAITKACPKQTVLIGGGAHSSSTNVAVWTVE